MSKFNENVEQLFVQRPKHELKHSTVNNLLHWKLSHSTLLIVMWNSDVGCRLGYEEGFENNSLVVMDLEVLLGLGSHGNPQAQQRVKIV